MYKKGALSLKNPQKEMKNHMKRIKKFGLIVAALCLNAAPLWAADSVAREDNSDLFVWIFLAFCALIVVAQLIPAVMMLLGFSKGFKKEKAPTAPKPVDRLTSTEV
jgi:hypothetical protein